MDGLKCFEMENFKNDRMWFLGDDEDHIKAKRAEGMDSIRLEDYFTIGVGVVSACDKAFLLRDEDYYSLNDDEKRYVFRFIKAKNCNRYDVREFSNYFFVDEITDEDELKKLPYIYSRLYSYKKDLEERYISKNKKWWHWATVRNFDVYVNNLNSEKIFLPVLDRALRARFAYTDGPYYGSGDVLVIVKRDGTRECLKYLVAWLSSDLIHEWYGIKGSKKGLRKQYTQAYVSMIPYRPINWDSAREVEIYNEIILRVDYIRERNDVEENESKINELFKELVK